MSAILHKAVYLSVWMLFIFLSASWHSSWIFNALSSSLYPSSYFYKLYRVYPRWESRYEWYILWAVSYVFYLSFQLLLCFCQLQDWCVDRLAQNIWISSIIFQCGNVLELIWSMIFRKSGQVFCSMLVIAFWGWLWTENSFLHLLLYLQALHQASFRCLSWELDRGWDTASVGASELLFLGFQNDFFQFIFGFSWLMFNDIHYIVQYKLLGC